MDYTLYKIPDSEFIPRGYIKSLTIEVVSNEFIIDEQNGYLSEYALDSSTFNRFGWTFRSGYGYIIRFKYENNNYFIIVANNLNIRVNNTNVSYSGIYVPDIVRSINFISNDFVNPVSRQALSNFIVPFVIQDENKIMTHYYSTDLERAYNKGMLIIGCLEEDDSMIYSYPKIIRGNGHWRFVFDFYYGDVTSDEEGVTIYLGPNVFRGSVEKHFIIDLSQAWEWGVFADIKYIPVARTYSVGDSPQ